MLSSFAWAGRLSPDPFSFPPISPSLVSFNGAANTMQSCQICHSRCHSSYLSSFCLVLSFDLWAAVSLSRNIHVHLAVITLPSVLARLGNPGLVLYRTSLWPPTLSGPGRMYFSWKVPLHLPLSDILKTLGAICTTSISAWTWSSGALTLTPTELRNPHWILTCRFLPLVVVFTN